MANKKKGKVVQMLSPENYIRQRARTLSIFECWINDNWEETGLASIMVARKHSNGNITSGMYLVDLKCLGVKDAHYFFNIPEYEFRELLEHAGETMNMESLSYTLAHNIIFAGIEFAGEYGFKPHKDFTSVAQYILEEDTDEVELMEIECGRNGKPAYVRGPYESDAWAAQIVVQLERTAGPGNYYFFDQKDFDDDNFDDDDDEDFFNPEDWDDEGNEDFQEMLKTKSPGLQFKIQLKGVDAPPVWRRVIVPSHYTFGLFHAIIQDVFGWESAHLYSFSPDGWGSSPQIKEIDDEDEDEDEDGRTLEAGEIPLSDIFREQGQKFIYIYDFGDDWVHQITLEEILQEEISQPACIGGKGQCPPEDCGGLPGYQNLKAVLANPSDPEHAKMKEWLGLDDDEAWDPEEFNLREVQEMLASFYSLDERTDED
jgi:hypothetical protein